MNSIELIIKISEECPTLIIFLGNLPLIESSCKEWYDNLNILKGKSIFSFSAEYYIGYDHRKDFRYQNYLYFVEEGLTEVRWGIHGENDEFYKLYSVGKIFTTEFINELILECKKNQHLFSFV